LETYHARFISNSVKDYEAKVTAIINKHYSEADKKRSPDHVNSYREIMFPPAQNGRKHIILKSRLGYLLLADFEIWFERLNYTLPEFIQKILDTRTYYTHYDAEKEEHVFPGHILSYVNGILMNVLAYYILKEIGIDSKKIIEKIGRNLSGIQMSYSLREKSTKLFEESVPTPL